MLVGLSFGPVSLRLETDVWSPLLEPFRSDAGPGWTLRFDTATHGGSGPVTLEALEGARARLEGAAFTAELDSELGRGTVSLSAAAPEIALLSALGAFVAWQAARHGLVVLHAGAVNLNGSVAAILASPGGGKSTAARACGDRAFAYNGLLVRERDATCWPLPFTGGDDPVLRSSAPATLTTAICLEKGPSLAVERLEPGRATNALVERVVTLRGDASSVESIVSTLLLAPRLRWWRVRQPIGSDIVAAIASEEGTGRVPE